MNKYHPCYKDQRDAIDWANEVLRKHKKFVILDTETTGLGNRDEIIELALLSPNGDVLYNERFMPSCSIGKEATKIHGITKKDLKDCSTITEAGSLIKKAIGKRQIIAYNAKFDARLYAQSVKNINNGYAPVGEWFCAMDIYAQFVGEINPQTGTYKWQKLQGGDHTALGDCEATLSIIKTMASTQKLKKWWQFWIV